MQNGDRRTQPGDDVEMPTNTSQDGVAVQVCVTATATDFEPCVATKPPGASPESTPKLSDRARLRSRIASIWQQLREQRRQAAAVVVMIVIAILWFDSDSSGSGTASDSPGELDRYETLLSDFEPVGDDQVMQESSDPFEVSSQSSLLSDLFVPQTEGSSPTDSVAAKKASRAQAPVNHDSGQQPPRKVRFAGRIQPAN